MHLPTLARAAQVLSGVIIPLYGYPGNAPACAKWDTLFTTLDCYDGLPFIVIVNPDSGPGSLDTNYQSCVAQLKTYPNVQVAGYVDTGYGAQDAYWSTEFVQGNITTYASWESSALPTGIFFDNVPTGTDMISLYTTYASEARASFNGDTGALGLTRAVMFNPGTPPDAGYFNIADLIMTTEMPYDDFSLSQIKIGASTPSQKQVVCLYDAPHDYDTLTEWYEQLIYEDNIAALFITDVSYEKLSPSLQYVPQMVAQEDSDLGLTSPFESTFENPSCWDYALSFMYLCILITQAMPNHAVVSIPLSVGLMRSGSWLFFGSTDFSDIHPPKPLQS